MNASGDKRIQKPEGILCLVGNKEKYVLLRAQRGLACDFRSRWFLSGVPSLEEAWLQLLEKGKRSAWHCVVEISTVLIG